MVLIVIHFSSGLFHSKKLKAFLWIHISHYDVYEIFSGMLKWAFINAQISAENDHSTEALHSGWCRVAIINIRGKFEEVIFAVWGGKPRYFSVPTSMNIHKHTHTCLCWHDIFYQVCVHWDHISIYKHIDTIVEVRTFYKGKSCIVLLSFLKDQLGLIKFITICCEVLFTCRNCLE